MDPEQAVQAARDRGAGYCDVRIETVRTERISWKDGLLHAVSSSHETGFGLRVLVDGVWGFASSHDMSPAGYGAAVETALRLARTTPVEQPARLDDAPTATGSEIWNPRKDAFSVSMEEKVELLRDMEARVRTHPEIHSVQAVFSASSIEKRYVDSDGRNLTWGLPRTVAQVHFTARRDGEIAARHTRVGATKGWDAFDDEDPRAKAERVAASTVAALGAPLPKAGKRTVVVDHELAGVFAHEAVGHAAEADLVRSGESCFEGRLGERIGIEGLTLRDDATMRGAFGAYPYDDNGIPAQDRVLVSDGVLTGYLMDRESAGALGSVSNGAARAQDHSSRPLVRMSTTLIDAGDVPEDEVFSGIKDGVYCVGSRGGQVDTARGTYLFNAQEAYRIENGEVTTPLRDVSLTGGVLATLHNIEALGDTFRLGDPGYCGKGQWVPVCDGGPLVRIKDCLVGGGA